MEGRRRRKIEEADRHLHGPYVNVKNNNNESNKKQIWLSLALSQVVVVGFVNARASVRLPVAVGDSNSLWGLLEAYSLNSYFYLSRW